MQYRRLGKAGLKLSALSFGAWVTFNNQLGVAEAGRLMGAAYDAGINFFDNAEVYAQGEAEKIMGEVLARSGWARDTYAVSSKVRWGAIADPRPTQLGLSRKHIVEACHQAMARLQVDYLDLYFCHRPDPEVPVLEVVQTMTDLIRQGKVFYWGTSEWTAQQIMEAHAAAERHHLYGPAMEQPQYNMFARERVEVEYARLYETYGLGTTIWSPLKSGVLTGKYNAGIPDVSRLNLPGYEWLRREVSSESGKARLEKVRELTGVAEDLGCSMAQLAIAWCLANPHVSSVILGASRVEQLEENLGALAVVEQLDSSVMERIEAILDNRPEYPEFYVN